MLTPSKDRALLELLVELFEVEELKNFFGEREDTQRLVAFLPSGPIDLETFARVAVTNLKRQALVDGELFEQLRCKFPRRSPDIDRVASRWLHAVEKAGLPAIITTPAPSIAAPQEPRSPLRVLILASNPSDSVRLGIGVECRAIQERLDRARTGDGVELLLRLAVKIRDLQQHLLELHPDIVHFSGHGTEGGRLVFHNGHSGSAYAPSEALGDLFGLIQKDAEAGIGRSISCVVLNACYSEKQANILAAHVDDVIGIPDQLDEEVAVEFAAAFYEALAYRRPIDSAFRFACNSIALHEFDQAELPKLIRRRHPHAA